MQTTKENKHPVKRIKSVDLSSMEYGKVPPQAKDLEDAVLGAIMLDKSAFDTVVEILKPECFYQDSHQMIFRAFQRLSQKSFPIDILTTVEELKTAGELETVGGAYYVTRLTNAVVSTANIEAHSRIIFQKFVQRELIRISGEMIGEAYRDGADCFDLIDEAEEKLSGLINKTVTSDYKDTGTLAASAIQRMDFLRANPGSLTGVPSGFMPIDKATNGWQPTDLIILAARPSVGKTAFALNLAINAIINPYRPVAVGFFSLEMSADQLIQRIISREGDIHLEKITTGSIREENEYRHFVDISTKVGNMPLYIDDTPALNIIQFKSKARRMVNKHKVGLIILDYLQLMSGVNDRNGNREQEISTVSRNLKAIAKELKIPIIALSQLSRANEKEKREPQLSDLRESGAIEQDADMVMFLTRPIYQQDEKNADPTIKNDAYGIIRKNRQGMLSKIPLKTELSTQRWFDLQQYDDYIRRKQGFIRRHEAEARYSIEQTSTPDEDLPF